MARSGKLGAIAGGTTGCMLIGLAVLVDAVDTVVAIIKGAEYADAHNSIAKGFVHGLEFWAWSQLFIFGALLAGVLILLVTGVLSFKPKTRNR